MSEPRARQNLDVEGNVTVIEVFWLSVSFGIGYASRIIADKR